MGVWDSEMQTTTFRMDKRGPTLYSIENCIQYPGINYNGKEY